MRPKRLLWPLGLCVVIAVALGVHSGCQPADESGEPAPAADQTDAEQEAAESGEKADAAAAAADQEDTGEGKSAEGAESESAEELVDVPLGLPPVPVPEDNPLTAEKIALGKKLYFDPRLSKDGTISCATCHDPEMAWAEHLPTSEGLEGQLGEVNSPTVINTAYAPELFWDGRADSLEEQALGPMENPIEMGHTLDAIVKELAAIPEYEQAFQEVFGTTVTRDGMAKAIASFERTVLSGNSPYDRYKNGQTDALTESQQRGMDLFEEVGCATCHTPPLFSNYRYYNAGIGMDKDPPDAGRKNVTGEDRDLGKYRVPPLREVANTHPYYHDGSVEKLEDAVALMADGGKDNDNLSPMIKIVREREVSDQDRQDIVAFLNALSGDYPGKDG